jgi:hypothetical protein
MSAFGTDGEDLLGHSGDEDSLFADAAANHVSVGEVSGRDTGGKVRFLGFLRHVLPPKLIASM